MRPGEVVADRFEIEVLAGEGGSGAVYRARDRTTGGRVALKVLRGFGPAETQSLLREARLLDELRHPHLVRYLEHGRLASGEPWLAMEWLDGEDLAARLDRGPLDLDEALRLGRRLCAALIPLHRRGLTHRDVKPRNVFLVGGRVADAKLLDLGIAIGARTTSMGAAGTTSGTPGYMAPEQIAGDPVDARTDVFAVGCVLFHAIAGRPPFEADHAVAMLAKAALAEAPRLAGVAEGTPSAVDALIARCLARDRVDRPADAAELEVLIVRAAHRVPGAARVPGAGLGRGEQRVVSILLAEGIDAGAVSALAQPLGARVARLPTGGAAAIFEGAGAATDHAERAARCALALADVAPAARASIATGKIAAGAGRLGGDALERAAARISGGAPRVDAATAALLEGRFELDPDDGGAVLRGARSEETSARTFLGRASTFVGRRAELALLEGVVVSAVEDGRPAAALLIGAAGLGKSRLRDELVSRLRSRAIPVEVLRARAEPVIESSPLALAARLVRRAAGLGGVTEIEERRALLLQRAGACLPREEAARVAAYLGELAGVRFADDAVPELASARRDPQTLGDQVRRAFTRWLDAECARTAVCLVLDDLQWADAASLALIDAALAADERALAVIGIGRPEVEERFESLWTARAVQAVRLGPLPRAASEAMVRAALGATAAPDEVTRIVERAAGHPFYLEELIRAHASGVAELPETVLGMVQARLHPLDEDARRVLRGASLLGDAFGDAALAVVSGVDPVAPWLEALARSELVVRRAEARGSAREGWAFRHRLVREAAYAMLTEDDRRRGHRLAGEWIAKQPDADPSEIAAHFERAGAPERAIDAYTMAAERALAALALDVAEARAARAIELGAGGDVRLRAGLARAHARMFRGDNAGAYALATEVLRDAPDGERWSSAASIAIQTGGRMGERDAVMALARELAARAACRPLRDDEAWPVTAAITRMGYWGERAIYEALYGALAPFDDARLARDPLLAARILAVRADRARLHGDHGETIALMERVLDAYRQLGDERNELLRAANLGSEYVIVGRTQDAVELLEPVVDRAVARGLAGIAQLARSNLGLALVGVGRPGEARAALAAAARYYETRNDPRALGAVRTYEAIAELGAGSPVRAEELARSAVASLAQAPPLRPQALAVLADALRLQGRTEEALLAAREAADGLDRPHAIEEGHGRIMLALVDVLLAANRDDEARAELARARERLDEAAALITDPVHRAAFLEHVPEHARLLSLAALHGSLPQGQ